MSAPRLVVYDDLFPNLTSGFRLAELGAYLDHFPSARVVVLNLSSRESHEASLREYAALRPEHAGRIERLPDAAAPIEADLLYALFLNNAHDLLAWAEPQGVPFGFQLYPGGGFGLDLAESDEKLRAVLSSPMFSFVVVTQPAVRDYVLERFAPDPARVHLIGPGPVWCEPPPAGPRPTFGAGKETFDVGFVAHKYADAVQSKGYDFFAALAAHLAPRDGRFRFHVVGSFGPADAPLGEAEARTTFHGSLDSPALTGVCRGLDVVVSPNVPSAVRGIFDGFPTASCSQAALAGAVVLATDPLRLNRALEPGRDFLLLERDLAAVRPEDVERAAAALLGLAGDPARLAALSSGSVRAFSALAGPEAQLAPRLALLRRALAGELAPAPAGDAGWRASAAAAHRRLRAERAEVARLHGLLDDARRYVAQKEETIAGLVGAVRTLERSVEYERGEREAWQREWQRLADAARG